jgi:hypothetical protein
VFVLAFVGPLVAPTLVAIDTPASAVTAGSRWTTVSLATELNAKDTDRIDIVTAGEEQQTSYRRCAAASDPGLCRVLISVINAAAIVGSSLTGP